MELASKFKFLLYCLLSFLCLIIVWIVIGSYQQNLSEVSAAKESMQASLIGANDPSPILSAPVQTKPIRDWSVQNLSFNAQTAIAVETDLNGADKVLFNKNEAKQVPIASLTKLMTALVAFKNYGLDKVSVVSQAAVDQEGTQGGLVAGDVLSVSNLLYITLIESSNDAAYALAEIKGVKGFIDEMNRKGMELKLYSSNFKDVAGLDSGSVSTASNLVELTKYILKNQPEIFQISMMDKYSLYTPQGKFHHQLISTDELLEKIPNVVGGKTGQTEVAKGCLLLVVKNPKAEDYIIYLLLGSNDRFGDMQQMIDWVNKAYSW